MFHLGKFNKNRDTQTHKQLVTCQNYDSLQNTLNHFKPL